MIYCYGFSSLKYYLNNMEYHKFVKEATLSFHECPGGVMVIMFVFGPFEDLGSNYHSK